MSCTVIGRSDAPKRVRYIAPELPDDLLNYILLKLDFKSKVIAGQVCKKWDELLKASSAGAKHWGVVCYKINSRVRSQGSTKGKMVPFLQQFEAGMGRCVTFAPPLSRSKKKQLYSPFPKIERSKKKSSTSSLQDMPLSLP